MGDEQKNQMPLRNGSSLPGLSRRTFTGGGTSGSSAGGGRPSGGSGGFRTRPSPPSYRPRPPKPAAPAPTRSASPAASAPVRSTPPAAPVQTSAPAEAGTSAWPKDVADKVFLDMYREFSRGYRRMRETPTARLVHRMNEDRTNFPEADRLAEEYPKPPAPEKPGEEEKREPLVASRKDQQDLDRTMRTGLTGIKEQGKNVRSLVSELGRDFSQVLSQLSKGGLNQEQMLRLTRHMVELCDAGEDTRARYGQHEMVAKVFRVLDRVRGFADRVSNVLQADIRLNRSRRYRNGAIQRLSGFREDREQGSTPSGLWGDRFDRLTTARSSQAEEIDGYSEFEEQSYHPRREGNYVNGRSGRRFRLDEELTAMRRERIPGIGRIDIQKLMDRDKELTAFEQYDISHELASANKKRRRAGGMDLLLQDGMSIGRALASLDPVTGRMLSGLMDALVRGGQQVGQKITQTRDQWRQWAGTNQSAEQKAQRRHNLAHMMYRQLCSLRDLDILGEPVPAETLGITQDQVIRAKMIMNGFQNVYANMDATGREAQIAASADGRAAIDNIRKGFYRDNQ